ncbi:UNVERIFIED_CONTAM: hypothetical protein GTU68_035447, partial [Idotea baltica]|nr:hypothetical protein [Idotea baltica]
MRDPLTPREKLAATLRFLVSGCIYEDLKFSTRISAQALGKFIPETCKAIYESLKEQYLKTPSTHEEWKEVAKEFDSLWQFPNCCGSIDGKHIRIKAPQNCGSYFYNYKGFHSVVLMALVNANYEFLYVDIGCNGRISDGGVFANCVLGRRLITDDLNLPECNMAEDLPYVLIGDDAFPLHKNLLKPY